MFFPAGFFKNISVEFLMSFGVKQKIFQLIESFFGGAGGRICKASHQISSDHLRSKENVAYL